MIHYGFAADEIAARSDEKVRAPALIGPHDVIDPRVPASFQCELAAMLCR